MDAGKRTINDIFNGSRVLEIPFFQRAYVWGEEQWERLLEDIDNVCRSNEPYFMGSVILKQQQTSTMSRYGDIRTVIDGQQRLTTLSILLKVLCLKTGKMNQFDKRFRLDDETTVLKHNHNDLDSYTDIMNLTSEDNIDKKDRITEAYKYFCDYLNPDKVRFDAITNKMLFVVIDLSSEEDEQQIFDSINSLGVKLNTAELLKNYFFNRDDLQAYHIYWKNVFEKDEETKAYWDRELTAGRFRRSFIDLFFYSYLQIKLQDVSLSVKAEDKIHFSKVDKLFESYKKFIERYYDGDKSILRDEIRHYAILFKKVFDPEVVNNELPAKAGLERLNAIIFALETTTLIPYILFVESNVNDNAAKIELYEFIESYIMRRLVTRASTKNYNQLFTDRLIMNRILSKQEFLEFLEKRDDRVNYLPSDMQVQEAFNNYVLTNKQATGVLYFIESKIRDRTRHSTQLLGMNKYSLEHIMPKKWINHWEIPAEQSLIDERHRKLLTLGNLTIITQALNTSIRDADWETKKVGRGDDKAGLKKYAEGIDTFSEFLVKDKWDEVAIEERADFLTGKALEVWNVGNTRSYVEPFKPSLEHVQINLNLEKQFHLEMQQIYACAKKELKYNPSRFIQLVSEKGGVRAAKDLIAKDGGTYGFEVLWENKRLDLSVEAHVLKPEYKVLFSEEEIKMCHSRLQEFGFAFPEDN